MTPTIDCEELDEIVIDGVYYGGSEKGALLIPGLNGAIVIGGGAVLFGWELYELVQGN